MKKNKIIGFAAGCVFSLSMFGTLCSIHNMQKRNDFKNVECLNDKSSTFKITDSETNISKFVKPVFGNKIISDYDYAYNLDDKADYICVEFENGGYAIYEKNTMELLEYSNVGELPYNDENGLKYYLGPSKYYYKNYDQLFDSSTNKRIKIRSSEFEAISNRIRNLTVNKDSKKYSIEMDKDNVLKNTPKRDGNIVASLEKGTLISNYKYFTTPPTIGDNYSGHTYGNGNSGTCGPISAQLLLSYNNYYNDRRIIPDNYLNGYDDNNKTISDPERNPNYCSDPTSMTKYTLGSRSEDTGENSFYSEIISRIMKPKTSGSSVKEVKNGINSYLKTRLSTKDYTLKYDEEGWSLWDWGYVSISSKPIKKEIDEGRPIIISMSSDLGGSDHFVVGYGYQDYTYPDNKGTYSGYVVHYGWSDKDGNGGDTNVWINQKWCDGYISLKMGHEHDYYERKELDDGRKEFVCSECGHRTDASIENSYNDRYIERMVDLESGGYKDFHVRFSKSGNRQIQSISDMYNGNRTKDTVLELYDKNYNLLTSNDDGGHSRNAIINYNFEKDKVYFLRVKFYNKKYSGRVKLGITPSKEENNPYNYSSSLIGDEARFEFDSVQEKSNVKVIRVSSPGTYIIETVYEESINDTYLYVVDPTTTKKCKYNDDGGQGLQAKLIVDLEQNINYYVVVTPYSINSTSGKIVLRITKV